MPVHPVMRNNRIYGYQWGSSGKIYPITKFGSMGAKANAELQGRAAYAGGYKGSKRVKVKKHRRKGKMVKKHWRQIK